MDIGQFKSFVQSFMADGLMLVIGSGLSCAEGLPGMGALIDAIDHAMPTATAQLQTEWTTLGAACRSIGLEPALKAHAPTDEMEAFLKVVIAGAISEKEKIVFEAVISGRRELPLSSLMSWIGFPEHGLPILTTNYDRLVELACESAQISVDTLFDGKVLGRLNPDRWRYDQVAEMKADRGRSRAVFRKFARVLKPHGSLDWWDGPSGPLRYAGELSSSRMLVTPGTGKYRAGYEDPFDTQRTIANDLLSRCERVLLVGYGFNDDHLEATRLGPQILGGKLALLVTRQLTDNALGMMGRSPKFTAIESLDPISGKTR